MKNTQPHRIKTISDYHRMRGMPRPQHPLITVINPANVGNVQFTEPVSLVLDFYAISVKRHFNAKIKYGQRFAETTDGPKYPTTHPR